MRKTNVLYERRFVVPVKYVMLCSQLQIVEWVWMCLMYVQKCEKHFIKMLKDVC